MAVGVTSSTSGLAFVNYMKDISESLNQQSKGRLLCKKTKPWTGQYLEWRLHVARTSGIGFAEDGGQFSIPGKQSYQSPKAYRRAVQGKIQLTDMAMAAIKNDKNSAKGVVNSEMEGLMRDILKFENWYFFRDGSGNVATVKANYDVGDTDLVEVDDSRGMWEGSELDLYTAGGVFRSTLPSVSSIASLAVDDYAQVDLSGAGNADMIATDVLKWKGATSSNAVSGLMSLIDDTAGTFQNVSVTSYPKYASLVMGNSGTARELTPSLFRSVLAGIQQKCGNESPASGLTCLTSLWDAVSVEEMYEGELRLSPKDKVVGLAVKSFQTMLGKVDVVTDADAPMGTMFFADFSQIYRGVQKPLEWRRDGNSGDGGSGAIFKRNDESGVYTATVLEIYEHFIKERHSSGRLDDLSYSRSTVY